MDDRTLKPARFTCDASLDAGTGIGSVLMLSMLRPPGSHRKAIPPTTADDHVLKPTNTTNANSAPPAAGLGGGHRRGGDGCTGRSLPDGMHAPSIGWPDRSPKALCILFWPLALSFFLFVRTIQHPPPPSTNNPKKQVRRVPLKPDQRQPIRVVLDRSLRIPYNAALLNDRQRTLVYYVQGP